MNDEFRMFLELMYSFSKQYAAWYEREIKGIVREVAK